LYLGTANIDVRILLNVDRLPCARGRTRRRGNDPADSNDSADPFYLIDDKSTIEEAFGD